MVLSGVLRPYPGFRDPAWCFGGSTQGFVALLGVLGAMPGVLGPYPWFGGNSRGFGGSTQGFGALPRVRGQCPGFWGPCPGFWGPVPPTPSPPGLTTRPHTHQITSAPPPQGSPGPVSAQQGPDPPPRSLLVPVRPCPPPSPPLPGGRSPEEAVRRHPPQGAAARPLPHERCLQGAQQRLVGPQAAPQRRAQLLHPPPPLTGPAGPRRHGSLTASTSGRRQHGGRQGEGAGVALGAAILTQARWRRPGGAHARCQGAAGGEGAVGRKCAARRRSARGGGQRAGEGGGGGGGEAGGERSGGRHAAGDHHAAAGPVRKPE